MSSGNARAHLHALAKLWGPGADYARFDWRPFREGVEICSLYGDRTQGSAAALLRYAPGAQVPQHRHSDWEHILVLHGTQRDAAGEYAAGSLVLNSPGSTHEVVSPHGCVVLVIWAGPVEILEHAQ